eukprot:TRINITY_DN4439_c0_g1_i2.p1 TRINITY_DN4439_c0_g1~~TRINITY_DN4439_c0_g1_i2.p1  ORF type:complete len:876 (-),score=141.60 TRINITY_DN4439_c0_g1_i2:179-2746(-)
MAQRRTFKAERFSEEAQRARTNRLAAGILARQSLADEADGVWPGDVELVPPERFMRCKVSLPAGGDYTLCFPLELAQKDYLRRVLEIVAQAVRSRILAIVARNKEWMPEIKKEQQHDLYYLLKLVLGRGKTVAGAQANAGRVQAAFVQALNCAADMLSRNAEFLFMKRNELMHMQPDSGRQDHVSAVFQAARELLECFAPCELLPALDALREQYQFHFEFKARRMEQLGWSYEVEPPVQLAESANVEEIRQTIATLKDPSLQAGIKLFRLLSSTATDLELLRNQASERRVYTEAERLHSLLQVINDTARLGESFMARVANLLAQLEAAVTQLHQEEAAVRSRMQFSDAAAAADLCTEATRILDAVRNLRSPALAPISSADTACITAGYLLTNGVLKHCIAADDARVLHALCLWPGASAVLAQPQAPIRSCRDPRVLRSLNVPLTLANLSPAEALAGGYQLVDLIPRRRMVENCALLGYKFVDHTASGDEPSELYSAEQLRAVTSADDMRAAGYSAAEIRLLGFTPEQVRRAGFSIQDLVASGVVSVKITPSSFGSGFVQRNTVNYDYTFDDIKEYGYSGVELRAVGCSWGSVLEILGLPLSRLREGGFQLLDLKDFDVAQLLEMGFTAVELLQSGDRLLTEKCLRSGKFSAAELYTSGFSVDDAITAAYDRESIQQLRHAGYPLHEILVARRWSNGDGASLTAADLMSAWRVGHIDLNSLFHVVSHEQKHLLIQMLLDAGAEEQLISSNIIKSTGQFIKSKRKTVLDTIAQEMGSLRQYVAGDVLRRVFDAIGNMRRDPSAWAFRDLNRVLGQVFPPVRRHDNAPTELGIKVREMRASCVWHRRRIADYCSLTAA